MSRTTRAARPVHRGRTAHLTRAAVTVAALALGSSLAAPPAAGAAAPEPSAVFVQDNDLEGNAIIAYERAHDGTLTERATYPTGGEGGALDGAVVDLLASQGSLTYDPGHERLYAVNAGSDTLTVFHVRGTELKRLQVLPTEGDFPVSVTAHGDRVYVLNALGGGSVQGYAYEDGRLARVPRAHRDLGLDPSATPQFLNTPGQVGFTPDGSALLVTTKNNGDRVLHYRIDDRGRLAARPVVTELPDAAPFGFAFDRGGRLVLAEAGPGAVALFDLTRGGRLRLVDEQVTGEAATCWVAAGGRFFYASNAGSNTVTTVRGDRGGNLTSLGNTPTGTGPIDAAVSPDGRHLYVRTGGSSTVDVFAIGRDGKPAPAGSVPVPGGVGGEGIAVV
ncbi:lactonase family protein [Streptomyces avicenniae]|uniref:lactonase family protein n=1 Tax=Streptomyces avicenniae TaxID=500153 RepID=UPI00069CA98E|nr:beta-propeller fold lactonase family protein [Streptomyces avicenniae]